MQVNYNDFVTSTLVENGQKTQSHYCIINVEEDETIKPLSDIFKCRDYIHDVVFYNYYGKPFCIYGFNNEDTADWTGENLLFMYGIKNLRDGRAEFERRIYAANELLAKRGLPSINYRHLEKEEFDVRKTTRGSADTEGAKIGDNSVIIDCGPWMQSILHMSMLTGILRMCCWSHSMVDCSSQELRKYHAVSEVPSLFILRDDYLWEVVGTHILKADKMSLSKKHLNELFSQSDYTMKSTIHNGGGLYTLYLAATAFGFGQRIAPAMATFRGSTEEEKEMPASLAEFKNYTYDLNLSGLVRANIIRDVYTKVPHDYLPKDKKARDRTLDFLRDRQAGAAPAKTLMMEL